MKPKLRMPSDDSLWTVAEVSAALMIVWGLDGLLGVHVAAVVCGILILSLAKVRADRLSRKPKENVE